MSASKSLVVDLTDAKSATEIESAIDTALGLKAANLSLQDLRLDTVSLNGAMITFAFGALEPDGVDGELRNVTDAGNPNAMADTDHVVLADATGGVTTVTLPAAAGVPGRRFRVMKVDVSANAVTVATPGAETINGGASDSLAAQYNDGLYISDGTNYFKFTG